MAVKTVPLLDKQVRIIVEDHIVLFNAEDIANAVGYSRISALDHHIKKAYKQRVENGFLQKYVTLKQLNKIVKKPVRKEFALYVGAAKSVQEHEIALRQAETKRNNDFLTSSWPTKSASCGSSYLSLNGIKEASEKFSMTVQEFSDWLVAEGYATRYASNNSMKWEKWFKDQGYGTRPIIKDERGERESNVAKITAKGMEFIANRLASQREGSVLAFAKAGATEREKLEKEVDDLIIDTFMSSVKFGFHNKAFPDDVLYDMDQTTLLKKVKSVIAQVKLKEIKK